MYTLNAYRGWRLIDSFTSVDYDTACVDVYALFDEEPTITEIEIVNPSGQTIWVIPRPIEVFNG